MLDERATRELIGRTFGTADDLETWPDVLGGLARHLGADSGIFFVVDTARERIAFVALSRISAEVTQSLKRHYKPLDIFSRVYAEAAGHPIASRYQFLGQEAGQAPHQPDPIEVWHSLGEVVARDGDTVAVVEFHRWGDGAAFDDGAVRAYAGLSPYIKHAVHLQRRIAGLQSQRDAAGDVLDRLPNGVLLVDGRGRVVLLNRTASEIIAEGDGLVLDRAGQCRARIPEESARLHGLITSVARAPADVSQRHDRAMSVSRVGHLAPLTVLAAPLSRDATGFGGGRPAAIVFLCDPERSHPTPATVLSQLYGLTTAEARVLEVLVQGHRPEDVARTIGVTINTVRTHLKSIYRKTDSQGQPELVRLVLTGAAPLTGAVLS